MNTTLNAPTEAEPLPFPSHVTAPAPNTDVQSVSRDMLETARDLNSLYSSAGNVHKFVRCHHVDVANGIYGIERLIASILTERGAIFPTGIESSEYRTIAIGKAMFASEVIAAVRSKVGNDRHPDSVIHSYLSYFMNKPNSQNKVGKIKLSSAEDSNRHCPKPRTKFYLVKSPEAIPVPDDGILLAD